MPNAVCKSRAVAEVRRRLIDSSELSDEAMTLAAGDGALDAEMLRTADSAIRPRHGELEQLNWTHPNLTITRASGILAGEEIINWFIKAAPL
jgi:hydroxymethylpyrimidine pyrophosphatase-like HAD family hydrolase